MAPRDQQRQRLYDAEDALRRAVSRKDSELPKDKRLETGDLAACQRYVDRAQKLAWQHPERFVAYRHREDAPTVRNHRKRNQATYYGSVQEIGLPHLAWAWRGLVLTHEVAHHITVGNLSSHGPWFAHNFVELLALTESRKLANLLAERFDGAGIVRGADAARARAIKYSRKVLAEAFGAFDRGESGDEYAWVEVRTFGGDFHQGHLVDVDDGVTLKTPSLVTVHVEDLAEVTQRDRYYRP